MAFDVKSYLGSLSLCEDDSIDLGVAALALAEGAQPGISLDRYFNHLKKLSECALERYDALIEAGAEEDCGAVLAALKHSLYDVFAYVPDLEGLDDLQNFSLIRVIERRRGLSITLGILCVYVGRSCGWQIEALNVPGHLLCRVQCGAERLIFDPTMRCKQMEASDLRGLIKEKLGEGAELSADYYAAITSRQILIKLQNAIKFQQIRVEDYAEALKTVETMYLIDPDEYRLLLDEGVLYAKTGKIEKAIDVLEIYIEKAPQSLDRQEALLFLQELRRQLS